MAFKAKVDGFLNDVKSITNKPVFTLSPSKPSTRKGTDGETKKDDTDKMKTKFLEAWNNFRYDMGSEMNLKKDSPIWILGVFYHSRPSIDYSYEGDNRDDERPPHMKSVLMDFASRPWFTYRKQFPPIKGTNITSDTGWGCMLRSVQMMIAQGFMIHHLGREWRWLQHQNRHDKFLHNLILGWFIDDASERCPLSVHHLSDIGRKFGNVPGNWYGPNTVAYIVQEAVEKAKYAVPEVREVSVYVAQDCTVYTEDVYDLCGWVKGQSHVSSEDPTSSDQQHNVNEVREKLPGFRLDVSKDSPATSTASTASSIEEDLYHMDPTDSYVIPEISAEDLIPTSKIVNNSIPMVELSSSTEYYFEEPPQLIKSEESSRKVDSRNVRNIPSIHQDDLENCLKNVSADSSNYVRNRTDIRRQNLDFSNPAVQDIEQCDESHSQIESKGTETSNSENLASLNQIESENMGPKYISAKSPGRHNENMEATDPSSYKVTLPDSDPKSESTNTSESTPENIPKSWNENSTDGQTDQSPDCKSKMASLSPSHKSPNKGSLHDPKIRKAPNPDHLKLDPSLHSGLEDDRVTVDTAHLRLNLDCEELCDSNPSNPPSSTSRDNEAASPKRESLKSPPGLNKRSFEHTHLTSAIILIPMRLGESSLNPVYIPCIKNMLTLKSSIGIIGGKPKHSLYFVGYQDESLLHLDPHYCQTADKPNVYRKNVHNYHTMSVRKTNMKKIDPSCCFGFYCRTAGEFEHFKMELKNSFVTTKQQMSYPICLILEGKSGDHQICDSHLEGIGSPSEKKPTLFTTVTESSPEHKGGLIALHQSGAAMNIPSSLTLDPSGQRSDVSEDTPSINSSSKKTKDAKSPQKSRTSADDKGSRFKTLLPDASKFYPKFMRQKSNSPSSKRKKSASLESLEQEFELL